jgi:hypothetical protein
LLQIREVLLVAMGACAASKPNKKAVAIWSPPRNYELRLLSLLIFLFAAGLFAFSIFPIETARSTLLSLAEAMTPVGLFG